LNYEQTATFSYLFYHTIKISQAVLQKVPVIHPLFAERLSTGKCLVSIGYYMIAALAMDSPVALHG